MTTLLTRHGHQSGVSERGIPRRIILVDPYSRPELRAAAELSGLPVRHAREWGFDLQEGDRVVTTVPIPLGARARALGILADEEVQIGIGESWPDRTLPLEGCEEDVLAFVMDRHAPRSPVVAVWGATPGLGVSTVAAALARRLAGVPLAVALVDLSGGLESMLELAPGLRWADLRRDPGPFLPGRIDARLPTWHRVRVLAGDAGAPHGTPVAAALFALAASHDLVVVDCGTDGGDAAVAAKDLVVEVRRAEQESARDARRGIARGATSDRGPGIAGGAISDRGPGIASGPCVGDSGAADSAPSHVLLLRGARGRPGRGVIPFPSERGLAEASARGEQPGDRTRGGAGQTIRALADQVVERL